MRTASALALVAFGLALTFARPVAAASASTSRHDGTVESVDPKTQTLVIWEFGANARAGAFSVHVPSTARVVLSERNPKATAAQHEFTDTPIQLSDVKRGDFVVVDVSGQGARPAAQSIAVTLRGRV
jgi:hypothetical protein